MQSQTQSPLHLIDFAHLEEVDEAWTEKHSTSTLSLPRNPFHAPVAAPAAPATPAKPTI
jgi:hypothetical protein